MQLEFTDLIFIPNQLPDWFVRLYLAFVGSVIIMQAAFCFWSVHLSNEEREMLNLDL